MHRRFLILFSAFWLCVLVYALVLVRGKPAKPEVATTALAAVQEEPNPSELADYQRQVQTHAAGLSQVKAKRNLRAEAARQTYEARSRWQHARSAVWSKVLSTNRQAFEVLRHKCEGSRSGETNCTICIGNGVMAF